MKQLRFGLSRLGLLAVALLMLPNLIFLFATPPDNVLATNSAASPLLDILENIGRFGVMASLIILRTEAPPRRGLLIPAGICLVGYYALWALYFTGHTDGLILLGLAVLPSACFLLVALSLRNWVALAFGALFAVTHTAITWTNYLQ